MENIKLTIPMTAIALIRSAEMLNNIAADLGAEPGNVVKVATDITATPIQAVAAPAPIAQAVVPVASIAPTPAPAPAAGIAANMPRTDAPVAASIAAPVDAELDADGVAWDARIHGKAKGRLVKTNTWKLIKGIEKKSPGLVEQVKAEQLRDPALTPETPTPAVIAPAIAPAAATIIAPVATTPAAAVFAAPVAATAIAPAADFADLMLKIKPRLSARADYKKVLAVVLGEVGLEGLSDLLTQPDQLQIVDQRLDQLWTA